MNKESHFRHEVSQGAVIENGKGEILILKLRDDGWVLPGGHLHEGEDWFEGLSREIEEETGITGLHLEKVLGVSMLGSAYGVCFHCSLTKSPEVILSDEHKDFAWISSIDGLANYNFYLPVLKNFVIKVFKERR